MAKKNEGRSFSWGIAIVIIVALFLVSSCVAALVSLMSADGQDYSSSSGNVAIIPIKGTITTQGQGGLWQDESASSEDIVALIAQAKENPRIKAVIFEINSPGGSAVASDEISHAIEGLGKPSVAWIREVGASGGYWVAASTDHIVANRMSITGSIGVIGSYLEYADLLDRFNVTYRRLVAGDRKDTGTPYRRLEPDEELLIQQKIDVIYSYFVEHVAQRRNLSEAEVTRLADGFILLGVEAYDAGLVDELGGLDEAKAYLKERIGEDVTTVSYERKSSLIDLLGGIVSDHGFATGEGLASGLRRDTGIRI
ncbi:MAG: signal peptide peptidase SppA [Nanoarchaeota archaeon]